MRFSALLVDSPDISDSFCQGVLVTFWSITQLIY